MAEDYEDKLEPKPKKKHGLMEVERYVPSKETVRKRSSNILFIVLLLALILVGVYGYYWTQSDSGGRTLSNIGSKLSEYNPLSWYTRQIDTAKEKTGNIWYAKTNNTKTGIIFEGFDFVGSAELPKGSPIILRYDLSLENTQVEELPLEVSCNIKNNDEISAEILPSNPVIISGKSITENIRCRIPKEQADKLEAKTHQVEGSVKFPFETKDVSLKVYYTSEKVDKEFLDKEDFFDYYDIEEDLPIRTQYNGEPIEIGIGVNSENIQPIVLSQDNLPLIGISLTNRWEGTMMNLSDFTITLPKGLEINKELSQNPNVLCPFEKSRSGKTTTEFVASSEYIKEITINRDRSFTFECWLNVEEDLLGNAIYTTKEYKASVKYKYELPKKAISLTIKAI
ncbi:MAG: hypothetical protein KKA65_04550 [Nanoarchaeota archaeon]|nr:hypothetical protein [Nanoarchaeota archaeon]MBU4351794.1 hypothetical protein [Nanoarchaeota archaeon]MBU4456746.1 hypothetical protein [Nanoarchaeota archaeon]MCG2719667.1 hypothetical protein [Nanoarchaeota archaeon]